MNLDTLTDEQKIHVHKKIEELKNSDGWQMLKDIMHAEHDTFIRKFSSPSFQTSVEHTHYNRGILEANYRMMVLPETILNKLKSDLSLAEAQAKVKTPPRQGPA